MHRYLIIPVILSFCSAKVSGQAEWYSCEKELINSSWHRTGQVLKAPVDYEARQWFLAGAGMVATGLAMAHDLDWQQGLVANPDHFRDALATYVGEPFGNPVYVGAALLGTHLWACHSQRGQTAALTLNSLQSVVIASGITLFLKGAFHRERPYEQRNLDPYQFQGPSFYRSNLSFPSGHTTVAFALASSVSSYADHRWYVAVPAYTLAGITGWSRIYQEKHWPSDVVLGALIGTAVGYTVFKASAEAQVHTRVVPNFWGGASVQINWNLN